MKPFGMAAAAVALARRADLPSQGAPRVSMRLGPSCRQMHQLARLLLPPFERALRPGHAQAQVVLAGRC